jgi:hypothetical protein
MLHFVFGCFADGENCDVMPTGSANPELYRPIEIHRKGFRRTIRVSRASRKPISSDHCDAGIATKTRNGFNTR